MSVGRALPVSAMEWRADGILLNVRRHGETAAIITVLTEDHGVYSGLVHGGAGRKLGATLQPGNILDSTWRARLNDHLGVFNVELKASYSHLILADREALAVLESMRALACVFLPERQATALYRITKLVLDLIGEPRTRRVAYAQWEVMLLSELGFGLDFKTCAVTGKAEGLQYVSPRSGRAVSAEAGAEYAERLLPLPVFLRDGGSEIGMEEFSQSIEMTGYFLQHWAAPSVDLRALPPARDRLSALVARA